MRKYIILSILCIIYSFPYVYFGMYQDYTNRSILGHVLMVIAAIVLAIISKHTGGIIVMILGNLISFIISMVLVKNINNLNILKWNVYFKPLTPIQYVLFMSIINLAIGILTIYLTKKLN